MRIIKSLLVVKIDTHVLMRAILFTNNNDNKITAVAAYISIAVNYIISDKTLGTVTSVIMLTRKEATIIYL
jgi:hypothetical protein